MILHEYLNKRVKRTCNVNRSYYFFFFFNNRREVEGKYKTKKP